MYIIFKKNIKKYFTKQKDIIMKKIEDTVILPFLNYSLKIIINKSLIEFLFKI